MKRLYFLAFIGASVAVAFSQAWTWRDPAFMAATGRPHGAPIMGWDSWRVYGVNTTDALVRTNVSRLLTNGMKDAGYVYINPTDNWATGRVAGVLVADASKYPNGMQALGTWVNTNGLKFASYLAAFTNGCNGFPGSAGFESADATQVASFGAHYIMYDSCYTSATTNQCYVSMSTLQAALNATGSNIMSAAAYPTATNFGGSFIWGESAGATYIWSWQDLGTLTWTTLLAMLDGQYGSEAYAKVGRWNMPDFLGVGNGILTDIEGQSNFSLWCILTAPLWASCNMTTASAATLATLTNPDVIAVDQDLLGIQGSRVSRVALDAGLIEVYAKRLYSGWSVCLFNRTDAWQMFGATWDLFGESGTFTATSNLWTHASLGSLTSGFTNSVAPHGVVMLRLSKGSVIAASEIAPTIDYQPQDQIGNVGSTPTFAVFPEGKQPFSYQWKINGTNYAGATNYTWTMPPVASGDNGDAISVGITNSAGGILSSNATLTVYDGTDPGPTNGLVLWWKFFDGSGSATDSTANGHVGALNNGAAWTTNKTIDTYSVWTGRTNGYVSTANAADLALTNGSVCFWFNLKAAPSNFDTLFAKGYNGSNVPYIADLRQDVSGTPGTPYHISWNSYNTGTSSGVVSTYDFSLSANRDTWFHYVGTRDSTNGARLYINGALNASNPAATGSFPTNSINLTVAAFNSNGTLGRYANAWIQDFRVYNRSLSSNEIQTIYHWTP